MKENKSSKGVKLDFKSLKISKLKPKKLAVIFGSLIIGIFIGAVIITLFNIGTSISKETAEQSAATYLTGNFLAQRGVTTEVSKVTDEGDHYIIDIDVMQGSSKIESTTVYVSKDGELIKLQKE